MIHPVFHCSKLKPFWGDPEQHPELNLPSTFINDQPVVYPLAILDFRKTPAEGTWEVLVQWQGLSPDETSWEDWDQLQQDFHLEDKVRLQGPKSDTNREASARGSKDITATEGELTSKEVQKETTLKRKIKKAHLFEGFRPKDINWNCQLTQSSTILLLTLRIWGKQS